MWISQDGKIHKLVLVEGEWGTKPSEQTECRILISDCEDSLLEYNNTVLVIGDSDNYVRRTLDICLSTMNVEEQAKFKILPESITFTVKLLHIKFNGFVHEWSAKQKLEIAQNHKVRGVQLYKDNRPKDAAYRFAKALKIIHSIPINAETPPLEIDTIPLSDIDRLKANLYNNLASFYLKNGAWSLTIDACRKVLSYEESVKAHYKLAVAFMKDKDFEAARSELEVVLVKEPENKAALELMKQVKSELQKAEAKFNEMVKKMFA